MRTKMIPAAAAALGLVGVLAAGQGAAAHTRELDTERLESRLEAFAAQAGGSVLVQVEHGDDTWTAAAGTRDLAGDSAPARPGDRVRIGSVTKSMTAAVVLQLEDEGLLDLDDPIGDYLPGLLPYEADPTVRQLLQHTSGVPDWLRLAYPGLGQGDFTEIYAGYRTHYEPEELIAIATAEDLDFRPGTGWSYSNTGYTILGMLIEERTGNRLRDELEARVFEPADLDRTYLPRDDTAGIRGPHAVPYVTTGDPDRPYFDATLLSNTQTWAGGGVISTVSDLNDFYEALSDGTLLTEEQFAEAATFLETGKSYDYGLGLGGVEIDCPTGKETFYGHHGDGLGHQTQSFHSFDGERRLTVSWSIDDKAGYGDEDAFDQALADLTAAALCKA
jgi:D-alanyl-D-alanine carboxypeptidase